VLSFFIIDYFSSNEALKYTGGGLLTNICLSCTLSDYSLAYIVPFLMSNVFLVSQWWNLFLTSLDISSYYSTTTIWLPLKGGRIFWLERKRRNSELFKKNLFEDDQISIWRKKSLKPWLLIFHFTSIFLGWVFKVNIAHLDWNQVWRCKRHHVWQSGFSFCKQIFASRTIYMQWNLSRKKGDFFEFYF